MTQEEIRAEYALIKANEKAEELRHRTIYRRLNDRRAFIQGECSHPPDRRLPTMTCLDCGMWLDVWASDPPED
jgi:hypothetical protein